MLLDNSRSIRAASGGVPRKTPPPLAIAKRLRHHRLERPCQPPGPLAKLARPGRSHSGEIAQAGVQLPSELFPRLKSRGPIEATQIPTYFELATDAGPVFIKQSATEHFPDIINPIVKSVAKQGAVNPAATTRTASGMIIESLESAITKALKSPAPIPLNTPVVVEGWELIFGADMGNTVLRTVYHAVPKSIL